MTTAAFKIWDSVYIEGYCVIRPPEGVPKAYELSRGISRQEGWSPDMTSKMSKEFPKDIALSDNLRGAGLVVISKRLREALPETPPAQLEFLPLRIMNHKGKIAADDYAIANPIGLVDCIDLEASNVTYNQINPQLISACDRIVLRADAVPAELQLFRPRHLPMKVFVRAELADRLQQAGFIGLNFRDPADFNGS
jgi:hypothetical protein